MVKTRSVDRARARFFERMMSRRPRPSRSDPRMPNGDPPSVMLWGEDEAS